MKQPSSDSPLSKVGERSMDEIGQVSISQVSNLGKKLEESLGLTSEEAEKIRNTPLDELKRQAEEKNGPLKLTPAQMPKSSQEIDRELDEALGRD